MIALLLNHLWQSSLCVGVAGLIALVLRRNSAHIRFWVWFAASLKFLVPFAALTALGSYALTPMVPPVIVPTVRHVEPLVEPFSTPVIVEITAGLNKPAAPPTHPLQAQSVVAGQPKAAAQGAAAAHPAPARSALKFPSLHLDLESALLAVWAAGILTLAVRWLVGWLRVRDAAESQVDAPVEVKFSAARLEPGLAGILNPVILLPRGIEQQLSPAELKAVLAHELCHWRRRDNLLAAIHMLVEALFWFFPLVWWIGARLNAERERACDESVLADGTDPQIYTNGILKVCRAYLQLPLACVAGVAGAGLKMRIAAILENRLVLRLNAAGKFALSAVATIALVLPIALGLLAAPIVQMQAKAAQIPSSLKTVQRSSEQALPPKTFATALPANQAVENPVGQQALQTNEAATGASKAPSLPRLPKLVTAENLAVPSLDVSQLLSTEPVSVASNDPPTASVEPAASASPAAPGALNDLDAQSAQLLLAAEAFCANNQVTSSDARYLACLDIYLDAHSVNLVAEPLADGSIRAVPAPIFPHSTFQGQGQAGAGAGAGAGYGTLTLRNHDQFLKVLDYSFALECKETEAHGSNPFQMYGACHWDADRRAEAERAIQYPTQSPAPIDQLRLRQAAEARVFCTAKNQGPSSPQYMLCVNAFLHSQHGWEVGQRADGTLDVQIPTGGLAQHF